MARQPRIDFAGAFHHVMNRGAARQTTFRNDLDRKLFIELWAKAVSRFGIEVISFCLMDNHYHVFVHSPDGQLSVTMQYIGRAYTQAFNHHHERDGALYRGRFHSVLVDSENYFARVARYIELNPVAAGLCETTAALDAYKWSSFKYYSGAEPEPSWLASHHLWGRFDSPKHYVKFVDSRIPDRELQRFYRKAMRPGDALGSASFVEKIKANHPESAKTLTPGVSRVSPEEIDSLVLRFSGADRVALSTSVRGSTGTARVVAVELAHLLTNLNGAELAARYGYCAPESVARAVQRSRLRNEPELLWLRAAVLAELER